MTRRDLPLLLVLAACSSAPPDRWTENGPKAAGAECNPIAAEWDCLYPYPSDFFRAPDSSLPGGFRVELLPGGLPTFEDPESHALLPIDFFAQHPSDGFSVLPQIAVRIPGGVDTAPLVFHTGDLSASQLPSSRTLLVDATTGKLVLHFAELDLRPAHVDDRALMLRPLVRLENGHRYVVVLQHLTHPDGAPVQAPGGFARIRDGDGETDLEVRLTSYYNDRIWPIIERAGVERAGVTLAWDFTTETEEHVTGDLLEMRRLALAEFDKAPPKVTVTSVRDFHATGPDADEHIAREILLHMTVPNFLERDERGAVSLGALLHRGANGKPVQDGTIEVNFGVRIPRRLWDDPSRGPARMMQYGHGFFGNYLEFQSGAVAALADELDAIAVATDWMGMAQGDAVQLYADLYTQAPIALRFVDRGHQGMVNFLALNYAARKVLPGLAQLAHDGRALTDGSQLTYFGISQGHILGSTYVALAPAIERAGLQVGGVGFGFMMSRAHPFRSYLDLLEISVGSTSSDPARRDASAQNAQRLVLTLQTVMDRLDPVTYLTHLLTNTYPGSPSERKVLMQIGIGDAQVPNLASHVQARSLGLGLLQPAPRTVFGLPPITAPFDGSAMVEFDFGAEPLDVYAIPAERDNGVHEGVRRQHAGRVMLDRFLRPGGKIEATCDGACDPE